MFKTEAKKGEQVNSLQKLIQNVFVIAGNFNFGRIEKLKAVELLRIYFCFDEDIVVDDCVLLSLTCVFLAAKIENDDTLVKSVIEAYIFDLQLGEEYTSSAYVKTEQIVLKKLWTSFGFGLEQGIRCELEPVKIETPYICFIFSVLLRPKWFRGDTLRAKVEHIISDIVKIDRNISEKVMSSLRSLQRSYL